MSEPRRPNELLQERIVVTFDHAALTSTTTDKVYRAHRACRVVSAHYLNKTGLAQSGSNSFSLELKNGSTVVASGINTATTAIAADTYTALTLSTTDANRVLAAGDALSFAATETGTATLPAGRLQVELLLL